MSLAGSYRASFKHVKVTILIAVIVMATLLVLRWMRDLAGKLLDRYAYRTHANFQRTVRDVSPRFDAAILMDAPSCCLLLKLSVLGP